MEAKSFRWWGVQPSPSTRLLQKFQVSSEGFPSRSGTGQMFNSGFVECLGQLLLSEGGRQRCRQTVKRAAHPGWRTGTSLWLDWCWRSRALQRSAIHTARQWCQRSASKSDMVLSLDFENAFNSIDRLGMLQLRKIRIRFPGWLLGLKPSLPKPVFSKAILWVPFLCILINLVEVNDSQKEAELKGAQGDLRC